MDSVCIYIISPAMINTPADGNDKCDFLKSVL